MTLTVTHDQTHLLRRDSHHSPTQITLSHAQTPEISILTQVLPILLTLVLHHRFCSSSPWSLRPVSSSFILSLSLIYPLLRCYSLFEVGCPCQTSFVLPLVALAYVNLSRPRRASVVFLLSLLQLHHTCPSLLYLAQVAFGLPELPCTLFELFPCSWSVGTLSNLTDFPLALSHVLVSSNPFYVPTTSCLLLQFYWHYSASLVLRLLELDQQALTYFSFSFYLFTFSFFPFKRDDDEGMGFLA